jgi:hypothetical protein
VPDNPFHSTLHMFSGTHDTITGKNEIVQEVYWPPAISKQAAQPGDIVYLVYVDAGKNEMSTRIVQGKVERIGIDTSDKASGRFQRIHTSIPFKSQFLGCPILNESKQIAGVVTESESDTVFIPASYIWNVRNEFNEAHTF